MFKAKLISFSVLSLVVFLTSVSCAQEKKIFKFKKDAPVKWESKDDLNLTDEQREKFDDLDLQHEKKMIDLRAELDKSRLMKREVTKKGNFNKNDYIAAEEKIMQAENKIHMEKVKLKMEKYSLLDEKQRKNFLDDFDDHAFMFKFDMDDFKDGMRMFKDKLKHFMPCPPNMDQIEKEIEIEIEENEI